MAELTLSLAENGRRFDIRTADTVVVRLPESGSGGYSWSIGEIDEAHLEVEESGRVPADAVGAGATAWWKFRSKSPGDVRLAFKRWRPWEGEGSVRERFEVMLHIRAA